MNTMESVRVVAILGPILALLALGFWLIVRSGATNIRSRQGLERTVGILSQAILLVAGGVIGLVVLNQFIGFPRGLL
jgi:hypothetical protein